MKPATCSRVRPASLLWSLAAVAVALGWGGCVERKITIGSGPPGALDYLNDVEVGRTPVTVPFTWYGDYDIRMRLDRPEGDAEHRTTKHYYLHTHQRAKAPWFEFIGIDLFAELLPVPFKDEKVWAFDLPEVVQPTEQELIDRARTLKATLDEPAELRDKKRQGGRDGAATRPGPASAPRSPR
jgi:hypothetical protein